jgi:hypothetical protein
VKMKRKKRRHYRCEYCVHKAHLLCRGTCRVCFKECRCKCNRPKRTEHNCSVQGDG